MIRIATWASLVLVTLAGGACGSAEVADISDILEGPPRVVDVTDRSARIVADTSVDVVCAVVYGPTTEYGSLATDDDMAGGGHEDHGPRLTGLQPDTTYHYAFGGVGQDGTLYRSEDRTFRTLAADRGAAGKPSGRNLALLSGGALLVGTSSNYGGAEDDATWGGNQAIDGDPGTEWSSNGDGDDAWIEIELPAETQVTDLGFQTRTMGTSAEIGSFQVVADGGEVLGPFSLAGAALVHYFEVDVKAIRLRFEVAESSGGNTGAVEIEVYGDPAR